MTGRKVKLAFIVNDYARKATYKKRMKGLLKKIYELSTLCGIEACAIIYGPYKPQPEIWPSPEGVQTVLSKFREMHEFEKSNKMVNQESFMNQMVLKAKEKLKNQRQDNWEKEMTILMSQCLAAGKIVHNNMSMVDLKHLGRLIDQNLKNVGRRLEAMGSNDHSQSEMMTTQSQIPLQLAPQLAPMDDEMVMMGHGHVGMSMNNNDIMQSQFSMDFMKGWLIDQNMKDVDRRLEALDNKDHSQSQILTTQSQIPLQMAPPPAFMDDEMAMMGHGHAGMSLNNNGIMQSQFSMDFMTSSLIDQNLKDVGRRLEAPDNNDHNQSQIMTTTNQISLEMAPPPTLMDDGMAMMGHGHAGMTMNNSGIMQSPICYLGDETIPFGEVDAQFLPNLLP